MSKQMKRIVRAAEKAGWRIESRKKALVLYPPDKSHSPVIVHRTPSDGRAFKNLRSELRNRGLDVAA